MKNINFYAKLSIMKAFILGLAVIILGTYAYALPLKKDKEPAVSTQGIEITTDVEDSKPSQIQKNEQKQQKNRSKKYLRYNRELTRQNFKKEEKVKELEYLKSRLELKKNKLETKFPAEVKGEEK